jgi:hypothetical protein
MTQDYLNHIFENLPAGDVPKVYWTADGTAFRNVDDANKHANRLTDNTVLAVAHGGKLEDAKQVDGLEQDVEADINTAAVGTANAGGAADIDISKLKKEQLQKLCTLRGIDFDKDLTKAQLIDLLQAKAIEDANSNTGGTGGDADSGAIDYRTMELEALQALCKEREIETKGDEDAETLIKLLTEWDAAQAPKE